MSEPGREPSGMLAEGDQPATISREGLTPDQAQDLEDLAEELLERIEPVVGSSARAREQFLTILGLAMARRKEWTPEPGAGLSEDRTPAGTLPDRSGGSISMELARPIKARRPFVGYDREIQAYDLRKSELLAQFANLFVVFVGDEMIGPFRTRPEAQEAGYAHFGLGPLFIKHVVDEESVIEVTRFLLQ